MALTPWRVVSVMRLLPFQPSRVTRWPVRLAPNTTYAYGTVLGELLASPGVYAAYNVANADGTQNPKGILEIECFTDANGIIYFPINSGVNDPIGLQTTMFVSGIFWIGDLVGLDTHAVSVLGRLIQGTVSSGILRLTA